METVERPEIKKTAERPEIFSLQALRLNESSTHYLDSTQTSLIADRHFLAFLMIHYLLKSPNISPNGEMAKLPYHLKSGFSAQLENQNCSLGMLLLHGLKGKTTHRDQNIGFIILHCLPCIKMGVYPQA